MQTRSLLALLLLLSGCQEITAFVVGGTVSTGKEVTKGVVDGIEEGRKSGEPIDGALIVTSAADLAAVGAVTVNGVEATAEGSTVALAFENRGDKPLRVSGVEVLALDAEGFVQRPSTPAGELTVPARAKDRLVVSFGIPPEKVATVRVWGQDLLVPPR